MTIPSWCNRNWSLEVEKASGAYEVQHYVIIPSYKEGFAVLDATVRAVAESMLARRCIRVVLAMEERDPEAKSVANKLLLKWHDSFLEMFSTYHPAGLPGEVAGKSSNTSWAFKEVSRRARSLQLDPGRTVVSVNDADCLWHPNYFEAVTLDILRMGLTESAWLIWQAPQLQLRNAFSVPLPTKMTGYASALFEIGGLRCSWDVHFCYSCYTMLLVLADNVGGWDVDVIAEDQHMFCKCFFASIHHSGLEAQKPKLRLQPVFLPIKSYLVEDACGSTTWQGYYGSLKARFVQARRHCQGVNEFSYVLLQWAEAVRHWGVLQLPLSAHVQVFRILWSMLCVHNLPYVTLFSIILANSFFLKQFLGDEVDDVTRNAWHLTPPNAACAALSGTVLWRHCLVIMSMPYIYVAACMLQVLGQWAVVCNFMSRSPELPLDASQSSVLLWPKEGDASELNLLVNPQEPAVNTVVCDPSIGTANSPLLWYEELGGTPTWPLLQWRSVMLAQSLLETVLLSWSVIIIFGFVPELLAVWHLAAFGVQFKYVTATKPDHNGLDL